MLYGDSGISDSFVIVGSDVCFKGDCGNNCIHIDDGCIRQNHDEACVRKVKEIPEGISMRILFVGEIYSSNLGDRILYESTRSIFLKLYPNAEFAEIDIMMRKSIDAAIAYRDANIKSKIRKSLSIIPVVNVFLDKRSMHKNYDSYEKIISKGYNLAVFVGGQIVKPVFRRELIFSFVHGILHIANHEMKMVAII